MACLCHSVFLCLQKGGRFVLEPLFSQPLPASVSLEGGCSTLEPYFANSVTNRSKWRAVVPVVLARESTTWAQ